MLPPAPPPLTCSGLRACVPRRWRQQTRIDATSCCRTATAGKIVPAADCSICSSSLEPVVVQQKIRVSSTGTSTSTNAGSGSCTGSDSGHARRAFHCVRGQPVLVPFLPPPRCFQPSLRDSVPGGALGIQRSFCYAAQLCGGSWGVGCETAWH